ncbi:sugar transport protein 7 [Dorcoceras hygrometricum]|uniref:Sugar transport protein 7 n=1 Tax=Dorcoceras hygrometricum TaxID=472368 RepID=A0A2Z7BS52_9LAMI|nr:sugar transport protein 7 [Dorcoceras hygrometricum]
MSSLETKNGKRLESKVSCNVGRAIVEAGVAKERAEEYKGRVTAYVIIACLVAVVGGSLFGYDIGISVKNLAHENNYCNYNNQKLAAFTSSLYLASLVSSLYLAGLDS